MYGLSLGAGDVSADERDEVAVGAESYGAGSQAGQAYVYDLATSLPFASYGFGVKGSGGIVPDLLGIGTAQVGHRLTLRIENGLGGATGTLLLGSRPASVPLGPERFASNGPRLLLRALEDHPFTLSGSPGVPGDGSFEWSTRVPDDPSFIGVRLYTQAFIDDPAGPLRMSHTAGGVVTIQP
jgi:hypothetical protein